MPTVRRVRTLTVILIATGTAFTGCAKKDDNAPAPSGGSASGAATTTSGTAAKKPAADLFARGKPALPAPAAGVKLDGDVEEAKKAAPAIFSAAYEHALDEWDGVKVAADLTRDNKRVRDLRFKVTPDQAATVAIVTKAWGEPKKQEKLGGHTKYFWFNPEADLRVEVEAVGGGGSRILYAPMLGIEKLLAKYVTGNATYIGQSEDSFKAISPDVTVGTDQLSLSLPGTEASAYATGLTAHTKAGKVIGLSLMMGLELEPTAKEKVLSTFEAKLGKPKQDSIYLRYPGPPKSVGGVAKDGSNVSITIGDRK